MKPYGTGRGLACLLVVSALLLLADSAIQYAQAALVTDKGLGITADVTASSNPVRNKVVAHGLSVQSSLSGCRLVSVTVTPDCGAGNPDCETGESVQVVADYIGLCPNDAVIHVDLENADGSCTIRHGGGDLIGIDGICQGSTCAFDWTVLFILPQCRGQAMAATAAGIYANTSVKPDNLIDTATPAGGFTFANIPATCPSFPFDAQFFMVRDRIDLLNYYASNRDGTFDLPAGLAMVDQGKLVDVADVDRDLDTDIITYEYVWNFPVAGKVKLWWYENNPATCFEERLVDVSDALPKNCDEGIQPLCRVCNPWDPCTPWPLREAAVAQDFTGDGYVDVLLMEDDYVKSSGARFWIYINDRQGNFTRSRVNNTVDGQSLDTDMALWPGASLAASDYDQDGDVDIVLFDYSEAVGINPMPHFLFKGDGTGNFAYDPTVVFSSPSSTRILKEVEADNDRTMDIIIGLDDDGDPGQAWFFKGTGAPIPPYFAAPSQSFDVTPGIEAGNDFETNANVVFQNFKDDAGEDIDMVVCNYPNSYAGAFGDLEFWEGSGNGQFANRQTINSDCKGKPLAFSTFPSCAIIGAACTQDDDCCQLGEGGYPYNQECSGAAGDMHCCPAGLAWNGTGCSDVPYCGNEHIEPGEQCDNNEWGPITGCEDFDEFTSGNLACYPPGHLLQCLFDTSGCQKDNPAPQLCGNGIVDVGETCDGNPGDPTWVSYELNWGNITSCAWFDEFAGGNLSCNNPGEAEACLFNTTACRKGYEQIRMKCGKVYYDKGVGGYQELLTVACNDTLYEAATFDCPNTDDCVYKNEYDPNAFPEYECSSHGQNRLNYANLTITCIGKVTHPMFSTLIQTNIWCPEFFKYDPDEKQCEFDDPVCDAGRTFDQAYGWPYEANCSQPLGPPGNWTLNYSLSYECLNPDDPDYPNPPDTRWPKTGACCRNFSVADYNDTKWQFRPYGFFHGRDVRVY